MDFFKKIGKEVSVFGLVFVVFIALFAYRQATHVELSTISQDKLEEKIKDKDSFVVVVGSDKDNTTLNYKNVCLKYLEKNIFNRKILTIAIIFTIVLVIEVSYIKGLKI